MQCPACAHDNLPGTDECESCGTSLHQEDLPQALAREAIEHSLVEDRVEVLGPAAPITVDEKTSVSEAIARMNANRIGCLLVTDDLGRLTGIFTERDVLLKVTGTEAAGLVSDSMTRKPETVRADQPLAFALHLMSVGDYRHLPLVDADDRPQGIISSRDVLNYIDSHLHQVLSGDA